MIAGERAALSFASDNARTVSEAPRPHEENHQITSGGSLHASPATERTLLAPIRGQDDERNTSIWRMLLAVICFPPVPSNPRAAIRLRVRHGVPDAPLTMGFRLFVRRGLHWAIAESNPSLTRGPSDDNAGSRSMAGCCWTIAIHALRRLHWLYSRLPKCRSRMSDL